MPDSTPEASEDTDSGEDVDRSALEEIRNALERNDNDRALELLSDLEYDSDEEALAYVHAALLIGDDRIGEARDILEPHADESVRARVLLAEITEEPVARRDAFEYALEADPEHPRALAGLGSTLLELGEVDAADERFSDALAGDPDSVAALRGAAEVAARRDETETRIAYLERAVAQAPDSSVLFSELARARRDDNRRAEALDAIDRAIELESDNPWHFVDRGRLHQRAGRHEEAVEDFETAISLEDSVFLFYFYRAESHLNLGNFEAALEDYEYVVTARPDYSDAYPPLATLYYRFERYEDAADYFLRSRDRVSSDLSFPLLAAISYRMAGEDEAARDLFREVERNADRSTLYFDMAREFLDPRNDNRTERLVRRESSDTIRTRMRFYLGVLYELQGRDRASEYMFLQVRDAGRTGFVESELAEVHLSKNRRGGYPK
ncbi:MAG: tetratricopeptide repeat protein [Spirochaetales bacterium]